VAHALSRRGLKVHAIARREDRLAQQTGCVIHALDIRETEALVALLRSLKVDVLVNNAGVTRDTLLMRMKDADWETVIGTDLTSVYRLSKACLRPMVKARKGRIINLSSVVGLSGNAASWKDEEGYPSGKE